MKMLAILAIILSSFTLIFVLSRPLPNAEGATGKSTETPHGPEGHPFELATKMASLQRYSMKLYYAGMAGNKALTDFYLHEMEETMEVVADAGVMEDGIDISSHMTGFGLGVLETIEKRLTPDLSNFPEQYNQLLNGCNSCHKVSRHGFIVITVPDSTYTSFNQVFEP